MSTLDSRTASIFIDIAGDNNVLEKVHTHFGSMLRYSCQVGATHWQQFVRPAPIMPGPRPLPFFAPRYFLKRIKSSEWTTFAQAMDEDWKAFAKDAKRWLNVVEIQGMKALQQNYITLLNGHIQPEHGLIVLPSS